MTVIDVWNRDFSDRLDTLDIDRIDRIPIEIQRGRAGWLCIGRRIEITATEHPILCEHLRDWKTCCHTRFTIHGDDAFVFAVDTAIENPDYASLTLDLVPFVDDLRMSVLSPRDEARRLL